MKLDSFSMLQGALFMKFQWAAIIVTVVNPLLLVFLLGKIDIATRGPVVRVLRGKALEIVDDNGKIRAPINVLPAYTAGDGQKYPETVLLRLIDPNGRPGVKIGTSVDGSGISLAGDSERTDWNGVQILAESKGSTLILTNKDGRIETITP
jgi:hypothetical protein